MKFSEHLGTHLTPEWRSQYVQYDEMKKFLYGADQKAPEEVDDDVLKVHFERYDEGFFKFCDKELARVNTFFAEKLAEAIRRFNELQLQLANTAASEIRSYTKSAEFSEDQSEGKNSLLPNISIASSTSKTKLKELKFIVSEFYLSLVLIQNFQQLNFTAFRKILKKHDKIFKSTTGNQYRIHKVEQSSFYTNKHVNELLLNTEAIAIEDLENGDRAKAMKRLRVPPLSERQSHSASFFWGLFTGFFVILLIVVVISAYFKGTKLKWQPAVSMYRGMLLVYVMFGLLGINMYGWGQAGVNHVLIFELNPRNHLTYVQMLLVASMFGVFWCLSCLAFLFSSDLQLPIFAHPLALASFTLVYFLNPTKTFHYRSRRWLLKILCRIVTAPYYPVQFADFWLADQLNSLVVPLLDFQYIICFYGYAWYRPGSENICTDPRNVVRPLVALLPAWWRFAQCLRRYHDTKKAFPHLVNAGKYATGMFVTLFSTVSSVKRDSSETRGALFYVWVGSLLISTLYTLLWDLKMDWGLLSKDGGENKFLREQIVYEYKAYYYCAMFGDVVFRFLWTLTVSVGTTGFLHHEFFVFFLAFCEVIRRFIWNFFRLENEHLNNVGEFRAVRDISIKPMEPFESTYDSKDTLTLEQLMELEDGPIPKNKVLELVLHSSDIVQMNQVRERKSKSNSSFRSRISSIFKSNQA